MRTSQRAIKSLSACSSGVSAASKKPPARTLPYLMRGCCSEISSAIVRVNPPLWQPLYYYKFC